jgi:hypothetical protein
VRPAPRSGHHRVADELLDSTTRAFDLGRHRFVEPVEHRSRSFRIARVGVRRRAREIGEEHSRQFALVSDRLPLAHRRAARRTEARLRGQGRATNGTGHFVILHRDAP